MIARLGDPVDLIAGLSPCYLPSDQPWRVASQRPLRTEQTTFPDRPVEWESPTLSIHATAQELLSQLFDYTVCPMVGLDGPIALDAGILMMDSRNRLAQLELRLGMDLDRSQKTGFLLSRIRGSRGIQYFTPEFEGLNRKQKIIHWLTPDGRKAMARLRLAEMRRHGFELFGDTTARQARRYLNYFADFGTHVVRSINFGECLFQIFAINDGCLPVLQKMFRAEADTNGLVHGAATIGLEQFTRAPWVAKASPVLCASDNTLQLPALSVANRQGKAPDRLLTLLSSDATGGRFHSDFLSKFAAQTPIAVSFACQAEYMEDFRADAWTRLLRTALAQQFPRLTELGLRQRDRFEPTQLLGSAYLSGATVLCQSADSTLSDLSFSLDLTSGTSMAKSPGRHFSLFAATNPSSGGTARVWQGGSSFDPTQLTIPFLDGILQITTEDSRRFTLSEGVWLGEGERMRPVVVAAPAEPGPDILIRFESSLMDYVRLMDQMQGPLFSPQAGQFMRRCACWLAGIASGTETLAPLQLQSVRVATGAGWRLNSSMLLSVVPRSTLIEVIRTALTLLALPPGTITLSENVQELTLQFHNLYEAIYCGCSVGTLRDQAEKVSLLLQQRFQVLSQISGLPTPVADVVAAGVGLRNPPDHSLLPHSVVPGDHRVANLWNGLLAMRTLSAECQAASAQNDGDDTEAVRRLVREPLPPRDVPGDFATRFCAALSDGTDQNLELNPDVVTGFREEISALVETSHVARLRIRTLNVQPDAMARIDPQLQRLLLILEILNLCYVMGFQVEPLETLAPHALATRLEHVLGILTDPVSV